MAKFKKKRPQNPKLSWSYERVKAQEKKISDWTKEETDFNKKEEEKKKIVQRCISGKATATVKRKPAKKAVKKAVKKTAAKKRKR